MRILKTIAIALLASVAWAQQPANSSTMSGGMSGMQGMSSNGASANSGATMSAMRSMAGHMDMGPHMRMTELRPVQPGDGERAQQVVDAARKVATKYLDYHTALADGFTIFHPEIPQKIYHFVNPEFALDTATQFNPGRPKALLYEKHGGKYSLVGVMYTAPRGFTEDQLNKRIPLSSAQWHEHVNICIPPAARSAEIMAPHSQFGANGSIATQEACDAAGGTFRPVMFNWMVHVYPFERDHAGIWSVER